MNKADYIGFHSLTPAELWELRRGLKSAFNAGVGLANHSAVRCAAACVNEVDAELARRGLLDPKTGLALEPKAS